jgi:penicillin-binding protein-related factor A (putative recombinase)
MKEKDIQTKLKGKHTLHGVFELKLCKGRSIRFDAVKEHQIDALTKASSNEGLYHKISDSFVADSKRGTRFPSKKPLDYIYLTNTPAYVVICFYVPRRRKTCYYIDIMDWIKKETESSKKSITESEVQEIHFKRLEL